MSKEAFELKGAIRFCYGRNDSLTFKRIKVIIIWIARRKSNCHITINNEHETKEVVGIEVYILI
jgi:hypothetical protein